MLLDDDSLIYKVIPQQFFEAEVDLLDLKATDAVDDDDDDFDDLMSVIDI